MFLKASILLVLLSTMDIMTHVHGQEEFEDDEGNDVEATTRSRQDIVKTVHERFQLVGGILEAVFCAPFLGFRICGSETSTATPTLTGESNTTLTIGESNTTFTGEGDNTTLTGSEGHVDLVNSTTQSPVVHIK